MPNLLNNVANIKYMFLFYGFLNSPLTTKEIVNQLLKGKTIIFWVMNNDCTKALMIEGKHMKDEYLENVPNTRNPEGDLFYDIPINLCEEVAFCI